MTKVCTNAALYASLKHCAGTTVLPGIRNKVYAIQKSKIVTWPTLPKAGDTGTTSMGQLATYVGDFTLAESAKWLSVDLVLETGSLTWAEQGEAPSKTILNTATLRHPEIDADAAAFAGQALNDDLVFLVQQRDGKFRVLGNEMFNTSVAPSGGTGEGVTGSDQGTSFTVTCTDLFPAPFYPGKIETEDGDISGADGSPWSGDDDDDED